MGTFTFYFFQDIFYKPWNKYIIFVHSIVWDLNKGVKEVEFFGHAGDVMSMSLHPDRNSFVTGSVDKTIKVNICAN